MALNWILPVRGFQAVLSVVVLGLMGYVASWWSTHWRQSSPTEVNFLIFAPSWSILTLAALFIVPIKFAHLTTNPTSKWGLLALEGMTMLFWFGGFTAMAVFLSDRICFGTVCDVARASAALSAINWLAWVITFGVGVMGTLKSFSFRRNAGAEDGAKVEMHQGV